MAEDSECEPAVLNELGRSLSSHNPRGQTPSLSFQGRSNFADQVRSLHGSAIPDHSHQRNASTQFHLDESREVVEGGADRQAKPESSDIDSSQSPISSCTSEHGNNDGVQFEGPPIHYSVKNDSDETAILPYTPSQNLQIILQTLQQTLQTLQQSSIASRIDPDLRARFWKCYKNEAEEFHSDFLRKYNGELDISLIFAGLFSAVSGTFVAMMQPNLNADPNATTQVLLMMVVRSLNSSALAGEALDLPRFTGPDTTTIWVQSLLYASLGASLFAALGAMLGKEWLSHYARVGERGTVEDRCIDRQRKFIAMQAWGFDLVLACIPLLLQVSLLLFGIALSAYMWGQQRTIASVIIATNVVGVILYAFLVLCSLVFPDCPFHTPITDMVPTTWRYLSHPAFRLVKRILPQKEQNPHHHYPRHHPDRSLATNFFIFRAGSRVIRLLRSLPRKIMKRRSPPLVPASPAMVPMAAPWPAYCPDTPEKPEAAHHQLDAPCVEWLLVTSTDPDVITTVARMVLEVEWGKVKVDLTPMLQQLRETFIRCFAQPSSGSPRVLPLCHDRALACGQAILTIYMERQSTEEPVWFAKPLRIDQIPMPWDVLPPDFEWLRGCDSSIEDADLRFVCNTLLALLPLHWGASRPSTHSELGWTPGLSGPIPIPPQSTLMDWFSHRMLHCLHNPLASAQTKLYLARVIAQWTTLQADLPAKTLSNCLLGSAMLMGYKSHLALLATVDKTDSSYDFAQMTMTRLRVVLSLSGTTKPPESDEAQAAFVLLKPFVDLQLEAAASDLHMDQQQPAVHKSAFHIWSLHLCRYLSDGMSSQSTDLGRRLCEMFQDREGYIRCLVDLSVTMARPRSSEHGIIPSVWQTRYKQKPDLPEPLVADDYNWIVALMRGAWTSATGNSVEGYHFEMVIDCLIILCEVPDVATRRHDPEVYTILSWAMQHQAIERLRHAGLKFARALCGSMRDVQDDLLLSLVSNMNGVGDFCKALTAAAPVLNARKATAGHRAPEAYMWILAYLDIICAMAFREEWIELVTGKFAPPCLQFADFLRSPTGNAKWDTDVTYQNPSQNPVLAFTVTRHFIGWKTDRRSWKSNQQPFTSRFNGNTYVRDIWWRLAQILMKCERYHPGFIVDSSPSDASRADLKLVIACVPWQICDTHPLPDDLLGAMVAYTAEVVDEMPAVLIPRRCIQVYIHDTLHVLSNVRYTLRPYWNFYDMNLPSSPLCIAAGSLLPVYVNNYYNSV